MQGGVRVWAAAGSVRNIEAADAVLGFLLDVRA
jgi:hypothetical protein